MDEFFHDLGAAYRDAVQAFSDAGCRYLQLDEVNFAYLCDENQREMNAVNVDAYFMEWGTDRADGLEPLRLLPKGPKRVVLGLVTSKSGDPESRE